MPIPRLDLKWGLPAVDHGAKDLPGVITVDHTDPIGEVDAVLGCKAASGKEKSPHVGAGKLDSDPRGDQRPFPRHNRRGSSMHAGRSRPAAPGVAYLGSGIVSPTNGETGFTLTSILKGSSFHWRSAEHLGDHLRLDGSDRRGDELVLKEGLGDAMDIVDADRLDRLDQLIGGEELFVKQLGAGDPAHPVGCVFKAEHEASLELLLGPP